MAQEPGETAINGVLDLIANRLEIIFDNGRRRSD
jgi:hypothetical protein